MKKFSAIVLVCTASLASCVAQSKRNQEMIIEDFVNSLADSSITNDEIREKFLIVKKMDQADLDFINLHLSYAREELAKNKIGGDKIKIVPYGDLKEDEKLIIVSKERIRNVYLVYYNNTSMIPILLENNRITAFATLDKGGRKYFMEYK